MDAARLANELRPGSTVIVFGERIGHGPDGQRALACLLACAESLRLADEGCGLLEVPERTNARGLREVGCLPGIAPGLATADAGMGAHEVKDALIKGELDALILWDVDPLRDLPDPAGWKEALAAADFVLEVGLFGNASGGQADVFLPGETHAEKEGTITHPDGRLQRLRPSIPHPGESRHGWQWLAELAALLGDETGIDSAPEALDAIAAEVPFYADLTHEEIGGRGVRWQEREQAAAGWEAVGVGAGDRGEGAASATGERQTTSPQAPAETAHAPREESESRAGAAPSPHSLTLGTYRDLWAYEVTERSPALRFLMPGQTLELSPHDAERLGVEQGDDVVVRSNGHSVKARAAVRERMRPGAGFLIEGLAEQNPNALAGAVTVAVEKAAAEPDAPERRPEEVAG